MGSGPRDWKSLLASVGAGAEWTVDEFRHRLKRRLGYADPVAVQPYRGYGTTRQVFLAARVLEDEGLPGPTPHDTPWVNLRRTLKMLETDEVPGAHVRVRFAGQEQVVRADREGYLQLSFDASASPGAAFAPGRPEVTYELLEPLARRQGHRSFQGEAFIPRADADWIVVSDIDDTVMHTQATSLLRMALSTLLHNAYRRVPFPGVGAFYRALHKAGPDGRDGRNPFFYVTSSLWGVYDLIRLFMEINHIPAGPLLMRDLGIGPGSHLKGGHEQHKLARIRSLLALYPAKPFLLVGDTGQKDAEIYLEICRQAPRRVLAVYLRDVSSLLRDRQVEAIVAQIRDTGVPCVAAEDTVAHARHAAGQGWIAPGAVDGVGQDARQDEGEGGG